jgi:AAA15 family ATPase/GTPase
LIQSVHVKNFQSLQDVQLELGKFTVIVGPSSSGKSAIISALRAIADNALDTDNITQGTKHASVAVTTESSIITIERSIGGSSVYKIAQTGSEESRYSKLNRQVPTQVTEALGILPSTKEVTSINFAYQHDPPYLLTETSSNAARILGELTNVSTIFAAVREASKKVKAASTVLNLRKKDEEILRTQIIEYKGIVEQAKALDEVESIWQQIEQLEAEKTRLAAAIRHVQAASDALCTVRILPAPPSMDQILNEQKTLKEFKLLLKQVLVANKQIAEYIETINNADYTIVEIEAKLHELLTEAGQCPLCLQEVK